MNLWIMSDLHVDSTGYVLPPTPVGVDVIVIAGDVADGHKRSLAWLKAQAVPKRLPVIFVLGNHELYGHDFHDNRASEYDSVGVTLLHARRPSVLIDGVRFVGAPLWTDFDIAGDKAASMRWFNTEMPDARDIDLGMRRLRARDTAAQHYIELAAIEAALGKPYDGSTVLVTHHAAHRNSLREPYNVRPADGAYASEMNTLIETFRPQLWIHGHTHHFRDYVIDRTRILCNPRGYSSAERKFRQSLFVEVPNAR